MAQPYIITGSDPGIVEEERRAAIARGVNPASIRINIEPVIQPVGGVKRPVSDTNAFLRAPASDIPVRGHTGLSIVDYLNSIGQPSDFSSRAVLAQQQGIQNYTGTAEQNTQLLSQLREQASPPRQEPQQAEETDLGVDIIPGIEDIDLQNLNQQIGLPPDLASTSIEDIVAKVSKAFGLTDVNKQMETLDDQFIDDQAKINENPWLTEGIRATEIKKLQNKHEVRKDALINRLRLQQDVAGKAIDVYFKEREFKKGLYFKQLDLRKEQIEKKTETERTRALKTEVIKRAFPRLDESRGRDGYVDPNVYLDLRQQYAEAIGDARGFDDIFLPMLSPSERSRLFVKSNAPQTRITKARGGGTKLDQLLEAIE